MSHLPEGDAQFRFYGELNDFLPERKKQTDIIYHFKGKPSIKDAIEAQGIPHPEVGLININQEPVDFSYHLKDQDMVSVYPWFTKLKFLPNDYLRTHIANQRGFILDVHLGKLARNLRLLGFNTYYQNNYDDLEIISIAVKKKLTILTRDLHLLFFRVITHGYLVRSQIPEQQLREIITHFQLHQKIKPFTRCCSCNGLTHQVDKEKIFHLLEPKTKLYYHRFFQCIDCGKIFWKGSHFPKLQTIIANASEGKKIRKP